MKILMVNKFLFPNGGSETYIFGLGKALKEKGHEVQFFGMEHEGRVVGNHAGSYTSSMDFHTGKLQKLLYPFKIIYSGEARKKIRKVLDDFRPDIVHLNNFNFQITPSIIYEIRKWGKQNNKYVPILYTAHDYQWVCPNHMLFIPEKNENCFRCAGGKYWNCTKNKCIHNSGVKSLLGTLEGMLYKSLRTYEKIDLIICPSRFMKEKLESNPALRGRTEILYNFLDEKERSFTKKKDYILYFGRYSIEKGIGTLVKVCQKLPELQFIFAGSGQLEEAIESCPNIENRGFLKGKELETLIAEARFTIYPSEWYENCPFSVLESQYYGTPVIASDIGGVPELLEDGVTGELFLPGDVDDLRSKIESLWYNSDKLELYTGNCQKKKFCLANEYEEQLVSLYQNLIDR